MWNEHPRKKKCNSINLLNPNQVNGVKEQMRRTLFRQALFKVQNVEVTYMDSCKADRVMTKIAAQSDPWSFSLYDVTQPWDRTLMREEVWSVGDTFTGDIFTGGKFVVGSVFDLV